MKRIAFTLFAVLFIAVGLPAQSFAEGTFIMYIQGWHINGANESRRWTDNDQDATSTSVKFVECRLSLAVPQPYANVRLRQDISLWPDRDFGTVTYRNCFARYPASSTGYWGDMAYGSGYYFNVSGWYYDAGTELSVGSVSRNGVRVAW